jgi:hypothetical protein
MGHDCNENAELELVNTSLRIQVTSFHGLQSGTHSEGTACELQSQQQSVSPMLHNTVLQICKGSDYVK